MDIYLPDGDGLALARGVAESDEHPDFIMITAARDVGSVRAAMQVGAVHYLVKPFGYQALHDRLASYRDLRARMSELGAEADQSEVDALFGLLRGPAALPAEPPKGHSAPTLEVVRNAVRAAHGDISAAEVAEQVGVSRPTAQRYLSYLAQHGIVRLHLRYGTTGRPEHRYSIAAVSESPRTNQNS
jgi:response regulator of citrate/malate metabolism